MKNAGQEGRHFDRRMAGCAALTAGRAAEQSSGGSGRLRDAHLDPARLGAFDLGNAQPEHAVVELGLDFFAVELLAQRECPAIARQFDLDVAGFHVGGRRQDDLSQGY